ncbi:DUF6318 family protein [Demequina capsici]|uniref:DUF6318 family protein n=1 Tax=Demequina capsici TaxID=3075620 RepID=A0AA96F5M0_9MICO|nr:DUF6318 family protein [Demequina sp. OYTSA14]WNM23779.1 DUF6318 family protein [Demequina sp. OYTSA14]
MTGTIRTLPPILLAGVLALAGCAGSDAIVTESPSSTAAAATAAAGASPSPSATALTDDELLAVLPAGATNDNVQGAGITATFWIGEFGKAISSGDTSIVKALSTTDCEYCASQASAIEATFEGGGQLSGGAITYDQSTLKSAANDDGYVYVGMIAEIQTVSETSPLGEISQGAAGGTRYWAFQMIQVDGIWRINGVEISEP